MGADVVAFQEMASFAANDDDVNLTRSGRLAQNLGYRAAAFGNARDFPSTQLNLYGRDLLRAVDQGWFLFSTSPEIIYSRTFNSRSNHRLPTTLVRDRMASVIAKGAPELCAGTGGDLSPGPGPAHPDRHRPYRRNWSCHADRQPGGIAAKIRR